ncbi:MAG: hypothetical protein CME15_03355 [Gemmatimonadetes bacterium]|nr:hypothetical protein [Gemmatimonadota bacterium]
MSVVSAGFGHLLCLIPLLWVWQCGGEGDDRRYLSPAVTYRTYVTAVEAEDVEALWQCFSLSYRHAEYAGEISRWKDEWNRSRSDLQKRATERQIADERIINARIAYLLFDSSTVLSRESPFCYFIRDDAGWKITSYLDSSFHAELELALERGEFSLRDW